MIRMRFPEIQIHFMQIDSRPFHSHIAEMVRDGMRSLYVYDAPAVDYSSGLLNLVMWYADHDGTDKQYSKTLGYNYARGDSLESKLGLIVRSAGNHLVPF